MHCKFGVMCNACNEMQPTYKFVSLLLFVFFLSRHGGHWVSLGEILRLETLVKVLIVQYWV